MVLLVLADGVFLLLWLVLYSFSDPVISVFMSPCLVLLYLRVYVFGVYFGAFESRPRQLGGSANHLGACNGILDHLKSCWLLLGGIWRHLGAVVSIWDHLEHLARFGFHFRAFGGIVWEHLRAFGSHLRMNIVRKQGIGKIWAI